MIGLNCVLFLFLTWHLVKSETIVEIDTEPDLRKADGWAAYCDRGYHHDANNINCSLKIDIPTSSIGFWAACQECYLNYTVQPYDKVMHLKLFFKGNAQLTVIRDNIIETFSGQSWEKIGIGLSGTSSLELSLGAATNLGFVVLDKITVVYESVTTIRPGRRQYTTTDFSNEPTTEPVTTSESVTEPCLDFTCVWTPTPDESTIGPSIDPPTTTEEVEPCLDFTCVWTPSTDECTIGPSTDPPTTTEELEPCVDFTCGWTPTTDESTFGPSSDPPTTTEELEPCLDFTCVWTPSSEEPEISISTDTGNQTTTEPTTI